VTWLSARARPPLDPGQCLVRIDPGPRQSAICQPQKPLGDGALRPVQTREEHTRCFADSIGDYCAVVELKLEGGTDQLLWYLEQLLGQWHQLLCW
jgi:hypothetical protein